MADRTAVLVTGSRDWADAAAIRDRLRLYPAGTILLHGDCGRLGWHDGRRAIIGADWIARDIARPGEFICWPLPYFEDLGRRGGPARNQALFDVLLTLRAAGFQCFVEAFPLGKSPGTRGMLRIVKNYNDAAPYGDGTWHHPLMPVCVTEGKGG